MKTLTLTVKGQYSSSNYTLTGSRKEVYNHLITLAKEKRRQSRLLNKLDDSVHSLPANKHQSKLVTIASFKINSQNVIELLNNHGVLKFAIN